MRLNELEPGSVVFLDANIFIYHFAGVSAECRDLLKRCEERDVVGTTGFTILAEVCHQLMIMEAVKRKLIRPKMPVRSLKERPEIVKGLSDYQAQIINLLGWGIEIIPIPHDMLIKSQVFRSQFGLLTNDSFIPVYMTLANTKNLATCDKMFSRIPALNIYAPYDI